jgi:heme/copper-type cytochrome/quinol oxidase subunit 1
MLSNSGLDAAVHANYSVVAHCRYIISMLGGIYFWLAELLVASALNF